MVNGGIDEASEERKKERETERKKETERVGGREGDFLVFKGIRIGI